MPTQKRRTQQGEPGRGLTQRDDGPMSIGGLAAATETNVETIRYYEREGVLARAARSAAGYRRYTAEDVRKLPFIRRARELGFSLQETRELSGLAEDPRRSCAEIDRIAGVHLADVEQKIAQLSSLRRELRRLMEQCEQGEVSTCLIVEALTRRP